MRIKNTNIYLIHFPYDAMIFSFTLKVIYDIFYLLTYFNMRFTLLRISMNFKSYLNQNTEFLPLP